MAKVKLGARPQTFKPFPVKFPMPDGTEGQIECTFRYRTRKEFGQMLNEIFADAGAEQPAEPGPVDFEALFSKTSGKNAEHLMKALAGWNLDEPLSLESLQSFADELPAGTAAVMAAYSAACNEGRLGN